MLSMSGETLCREQIRELCVYFSYSRSKDQCSAISIDKEEKLSGGGHLIWQQPGEAKTLVSEVPFDLPESKRNYGPEQI